MKLHFETFLTISILVEMIRINNATVDTETRRQSTRSSRI